MNATNLYTKRIAGLDYRIWLTLLLTCVLCMGFYGYELVEKNNAKKRPDLKGEIVVNGRKIGEPVECIPTQFVFFEMNAPHAGDVVWDFGDKSSADIGKNAIHRFSKEGIYRIVATVDGEYKFSRELMVKNPLFVRPETGQADIYTTTDTVAVGTRLRFYSISITPPESSFEWKLLETNEKQNNKFADFTFRKAGRFRVRLMLNNDSAKAAVKLIEVIAAASPYPDLNALPQSGASGMPPIPPLFGPNEATNGGRGAQPGKPNQATQENGGVAAPSANASNAPATDKAVEIDPSTFKGLLQSVLNEEKDISSLFIYLDYKDTTKVMTEDGTLISLSAFCKEYRKRTIKDLVFIKDDNKSIMQIKVVLKKRSIWEKIFGK